MEQFIRFGCVPAAITRGSPLPRRMISAAALFIFLTSGGPLAASDNLIVPGERIGPLKVEKSTVDEAVKVLGRPSHQRRDTFRTSEQNWDIVTYVYNSHCLSFRWDDKGVRPKVKSEIKVTCSRWQTDRGIRVGSSVEEILKVMGAPDYDGNCNADRPDCFLCYNSGVMFRTRNRHSPIYEIYLLAKTTSTKPCPTR